MRRWLQLGFLLFVALFAAAQSPYVNLVGTMQGPNGLPLSNSVINLSPTQTFFVVGSGSGPGSGVTSISATSPIIVTPSPITSIGTVSLSTVCVNQVWEWNGTAWGCVNTGGGGGGGLTGVGITNAIPIWTSPSNLGSSIMLQSLAGAVTYLPAGGDQVVIDATANGEPYILGGLPATSGDIFGIYGANCSGANCTGTGVNIGSGNGSGTGSSGYILFQTFLPTASTNGLTNLNGGQIAFQPGWSNGRVAGGFSMFRDINNTNSSSFAPDIFAVYDNKGSNSATSITTEYGPPTTWLNGGPVNCAQPPGMHIWFDDTATTAATSGYACFSNAPTTWVSLFGGMVWPPGAAGVPNYNGFQGWGTIYNASNPIPANFITNPLNQNTTGSAGSLLNCTPVAVGDGCIWNGTGWTKFGGNTTSTAMWLQEANGVVSFSIPAGNNGNVSTTGTNTATYLATWVANTQLTSVQYLPAVNFPALTGDVTNTAGSLATTVGKINGAAVPVSASLLGSNSTFQLIAAALTSGHIFVGNSSNLPASVAVSQDVSLSNTGAAEVLGALTYALPAASTAASAPFLTLNYNSGTPSLSAWQFVNPFNNAIFTGSFQISALGGSGNSCMYADNSGVVHITAGVACGSGSGGGGNVTGVGNSVAGNLVVVQASANPLDAIADSGVALPLANTELAHSTIGVTGATNEIVVTGSPASLGGSVTVGFANPFVAPGSITFAAGTTSTPSFVVPSGSAMTSPSLPGQCWSVSGVLQCFNGTSVESIARILTSSPLVDGNFVIANVTTGQIKDAGGSWAIPLAWGTTTPNQVFATTLSAIPSGPGIAAALTGDAHGNNIFQATYNGGSSPTFMIGPTGATTIGPPQAGNVALNVIQDAGGANGFQVQDTTGTNHLWVDFSGTVYAQSTNASTVPSLVAIGSGNVGSPDIAQFQKNVSSTLTTVTGVNSLGFPYIAGAASGTYMKADGTGAGTPAGSGNVSTTGFSGNNQIVYVTNSTTNATGSTPNFTIDPTTGNSTQGNGTGGTVVGYTPQTSLSPTMPSWPSSSVLTFIGPDGLFHCGTTAGVLIPCVPLYLDNLTSTSASSGTPVNWALQGNTFAMTAAATSTIGFGVPATGTLSGLSNSPIQQLWGIGEENSTTGPYAADYVNTQLVETAGTGTNPSTAQLNIWRTIGGSPTNLILSVGGPSLSSGALQAADFFLQNPSGGTTEITQANASATAYAAQLPANTGTIAELNASQTFTGTVTFNNVTVNGTCTGCSTSTGLSGMTATQVPIAASATTVTSSMALAGSGAGITTGPVSGVTDGHMVVFTGTGGQIADGGAPTGASSPMVSSSGGTALSTSSTQEIGLGNICTSGAEGNCAQPVWRSGTVTGLYCILGATISSGSEAITVRHGVSGTISGTSMTCTISSSTCSTTSNSFTVATSSSDTLDIQIVPSSPSVGRSLQCTLAIQ